MVSFPNILQYLVQRKTKNKKKPTTNLTISFGHHKPNKAQPYTPLATTNLTKTPPPTTTNSTKLPHPPQIQHIKKIEKIAATQNLHPNLNPIYNITKIKSQKNQPSSLHKRCPNLEREISPNHARKTQI
jgi:hypothetical protein